MEFEKLLQTRRSIRKYDESKKITEDQLKEIVRAGIQAPSWKNTETARYYGVLSDDMIEKVRECLPVFNQKNSAGRSLLVTSYVKGAIGIRQRPAGKRTCRRLGLVRFRACKPKHSNEGRRYGSCHIDYGYQRCG